MQDAGTFSKGLLALEAPVEAPRPATVAPDDVPLQVIADREAPPQAQVPRRVLPAEAVDAYRSGARISVRRMPAGYRKTIVA